MQTHAQLSLDYRKILFICFFTATSLINPISARAQNENSSRSSGEKIETNSLDDAVKKAGVRIQQREELIKTLDTKLQKSESLTEDIESLLMELHEHSKVDAQFVLQILLNGLISENSKRVDQLGTQLNSIQEEQGRIFKNNDKAIRGFYKTSEKQLETYKNFTDSMQKSLTLTQEQMTKFTSLGINSTFGVIALSIFFLLLFFWRAIVKEERERVLNLGVETFRNDITAQITHFRSSIEKMSTEIVKQQILTTHQLERYEDRMEPDRERTRTIERRVSVAEGLAHRVEMVEGQFGQIIAGDLGGQRRRNPFLVGGPVANKRAAIERSGIIAEVLSDLRQNSFYFEALPRTGKTSLLRDLEAKLGKGVHGKVVFIPVFMDLQAASEDTLFKLLGGAMARSVRLFLQSRNVHVESLLLDELSAAYDAAETARAPEDFGDLLDVVERIANSYLDQLATHGEGLADCVMFALLIDEFAQMNHFPVETRGKFRSMFMSEPGPNMLRLIAAGGKLDVWGGTSPFNFMVHKNLERFNEEEARRLIETASKGVVTFTEQAIVGVIEASCGLPMELQRVCRESVNVAYEEGSDLINLPEVEKALQRLPKQDSNSSELPVELPPTPASHDLQTAFLDEEHQDVATS